MLRSERLCSSGWPDTREVTRRLATSNNACAQGPEGHRFAVTLRVSRALTIIATRLALWHHQRRARGSRTCITLADPRRGHLISTLEIALRDAFAGGVR
jgi:hypothetical protein